MAPAITPVLTLERATRPQPPELERALARRWDELPAHVKTPNQMLGQRMSGCEGTHGVFPRCNLACTPCYHSRQANRVRVDGGHTVAEVDAQMALLRDQRGPGQHAQLIGGEVTLLGPDDHARTLEAMLRHGRKPMSMSHGDFDYDYLERLALDPDTGRRRFSHLAFAGHFDSMMFGRRGLPARERGRAEPVPREVLRDVPAAPARARDHALPRPQHDGHAAQPRPGRRRRRAIAVTWAFACSRSSPPPSSATRTAGRTTTARVSPDAVWREIERGAEARLHWRAVQVGDQRCNRTDPARSSVTAMSPCSTRTTPATPGCCASSWRPSAAWTSRPRARCSRSARLAPSRAAQACCRPPSGGHRGPGTGRRTPWAPRRPAASRHVRHALLHGCASRAPGLGSAAKSATAATDPDRSARHRSDCRRARTRWRIQRTGTLVPACVQHAVLDPAENARSQNCSQSTRVTRRLKRPGPPPGQSHVADPPTHDQRAHGLLPDAGTLARGLAALRIFFAMPFDPALAPILPGSGRFARLQQDLRACMAHLSRSHAASPAS